MVHALRRSKWIGALALLAGALAASVAVASAQTAANTITVCSILDATGPINIYGKPMIDSTKLAVADINKHGGVTGKQLNLVAYDGQSSNDKYTQFANQCALQKHAAVIMGGITSASREAMRPVIDRTYPLADAREAVRYAMSGQGRAKIVISMTAST